MVPPRVAAFVGRHGVALAISLFAVLLRTHRLTEVFASSDAADLAYSAVRKVCGDVSFGQALSELVLHRLGGVQPVAVYLHALTADALGLNLTAPTWVATTIAVSGASTFSAYLLGRELAGQASGLWAATLVAVSPIHIMLGRHLGAPWMYEVCFQLLIAYLLVRQLRRPSRAVRGGLCVALSIYFWCGNQMLAIFPVVAAAVALGYFESERAGFIRYLRERLLSAWLALPAASLAALLWITFERREGHLAHALFDKRKYPGWHLANWFSDLYRDIGYGPTWLGILSLLIALLAGARMRGLRALPLVYFFCYAAPFWVWISRKTTLTTGYVVYSITALMIVVAVVPMVSLGQRRFGHLIPALTAALLFGGSLASVYRHVSMKAYLGVSGFQGTYKPDNGAAVAAAFVRRHSGDHRSGVFSDASGGTGLEPPIMRLYFRRPSFSLYDARSAELVYRRFRGQRKRIHYLVIEAKKKNRLLAQKYFGDDYRIALTVTRGNRKLLYVYALGFAGDPLKVGVEEGASSYLEAYPELCSR